LLIRLPAARFCKDIDLQYRSDPRRLGEAI
jgi:hypothetical protein